MKEEMKKKARKVEDEAKETMKNAKKFWKTQSSGVKFVAIMMAVAFVIFLPMALRTTMMIQICIWKGLKMSQMIVVTIIVAWLFFEFRENGIIATIARLLFIVVLLKVAGNLAGVDTKAIDAILKRIVEVSNVIAKEVIPWLKFW